MRLKLRRQWLANDFRIALSGKRHIFLGDDVDNAVEGILRTVWQIDWRGAVVELRVDLIDSPFKRCTDTVHLIHESDFRHGVIIRLMPDLFRLSLNTFDSGENDRRAINDTQRTLHFRCEINMSGSVNQMEHVIFPWNRSGCSGDGDATGTLFWKEVHNGRPVIDVAVTMSQP